MKRYEGFKHLSLEQALAKIEELENSHKQIIAVTQDLLGYYTVFSRDPCPEARALDRAQIIALIEAKIA
jgi:hypothetical protein